MTVNVSGEGSSMTTQAGLSNSFVNVSNSGTANVSDATLSGMETTAEWNNGQNYTSKPLFSVSSSGNLNISDSEFSDNKLTHSGSPSSGVGAQGVITLSDASLTVSNTTFSNNASQTIPGEFSSSVPTTQGSVLYATNAKSASFTDSKFLNNSAKGVNVQGGIAGFGGTYSIEGSSFEGNVADASAFEAGMASGGGASFSGNKWGSNTALNLEISGTSFKNNESKGTLSYGGALYADLAVEGSSLKISESSFEGNKSTGSMYSLAGAMYVNGGSANLENTSFNGNSASVSVADVSPYSGGGALVVVDSNLKISATKDISNVGNYFEQAGVKDDSRGGFMFLRGTSTVDFDIAEGATYTIGDGTAGQDSIASEATASSQHIINKTWAGTLTVNGSMEHFTGALNVNQGEMTMANKLGASSVSIASDAILKLSVGGEPVLTNENLAFSNSGTLVLISRGESGNIAAASGLDFGNVKAYGGTFDAQSGYFAKGGAISGTSYGKYNGMWMTCSITFRDDTSSLTIITQGDSTFDLNIRDDSVASDFFGEDLLGAWTVEGNVFEDTVVMSFVLDTDISNAKLYHQGDDGTWALLDSWFADGAVNTITGEMGNFALAVPEPSTYALIFGAFALVFVISRKRK